MRREEEREKKRERSKKGEKKREEKKRGGGPASVCNGEWCVKTDDRSEKDIRKIAEYYELNIMNNICAMKYFPMEYE